MLSIAYVIIIAVALAGLVIVRFATKVRLTTRQTAYGFAIAFALLGIAELIRAAGR